MDEPKTPDASPAPCFTKKVFFLHPHSVIQEQLVDLLIRAEFDVALVRDHLRAKALVEHFPSSILFCNIDDSHLAEAEWQSYIKDLMAGQAKTDVRIGVLTYNPKPELGKTYLMDIGVSCGYIGLKLGLVESAKIILKTLEVNDAKGGRKFVRVNCPHGKSVISINSNGRLNKGNILNLSSAGLACTFESELHYKAQALVHDIQMQLWGAIVRSTMVYMGCREQDGQGLVHILLFDTFRDHDSKGKVFTFIRKALQDEIDQLHL